MQLRMPKVPRAFINHAKVKLILFHAAEGFDVEEQQALYFYCFLDAPINEIAGRVGLSQSHVVSVLGLYSERLATQLNLFKKVLPYDSSDLLPISEVLLKWHGDT